MKKTILLVLLSLIVSCSCIYAQSNNTHKDQIKASKKELSQKASKEARKEAKRLIKEGWKVAPGALPLEKQLDKSYVMQYQYDSDGLPTFIMAEGMSIAGNYDAAKMQALELAKQNLAGQIQTEITALIENTVSNEQLDQNNAATITRSVLASKNLIAQSIGRVLPIVETYRVISNSNNQVLVRIAYSYDLAKTTAKNAIKKELEERGDSLHNKLDNLLGW